MEHSVRSHGKAARLLGPALAVVTSTTSALAQPEAPPPPPEVAPYGEPADGATPPASSPEGAASADATRSADASASGAADLLPDRATAANADASSAAAPKKESGAGARKEKKLGPYEIAIDDENSIGIGFGGQLRTTITEKDNGLAASRETVAEATIRRLRFTLSGSFFDKKLRTSAQLNLVPGQIELIDLFANYKFVDEAQLQIGQFKIPYTRYRMMSWSRMLMPDWSLVTQHFGSERQLGVMLHSGQKDEELSYALGVFSGTNARSSHERGLAQSYGESLPNPSDLADPSLPEELHPELVARFTHNAKNIDGDTNTDWRGGGFRHSVGVSAAWDVQPVLTRDFQVRLAPEVLLKWNGLSANAIGYFGFFESTAEVTEFGSWGVNVDLGWRITELVELAARFAHVDQQEALTNDARARAAAILAEAPDDDDLAAQYRSAGKVTNEQEVGLGFNLYLYGSSVKWQHDVAMLRKERDKDVRHDVRARMQLLVAF